MEQEGLLAVKRGRQRSWVGVKEEKPHAYLREAMVSGLMDGICNPENVGETLEPRHIGIPPDRLATVVDAVGTWEFSAHDFSDDELLHAAMLMLQHALTMPDLERWRIATDDLNAFVLATRMAYNSFVPYHNFRHVVDVLQAVFYFLLRLGALPPYQLGYSISGPTSPVSPIASLLRPFEALTLLITAIGHDVGHPGVNNAFLVHLKAPLAQLYNDRSVLESFHCAAFSQILRRYWPASFHAAELRKLLINSILATDMGLHFDYMNKLGQLQEKLHAGKGIDGWDGRSIEEHRTLTCSLLIKCADISNVARRYDVAAKWATILTDEFARQASMEVDLGIPTALFAPPVRDSVIELGKSQIGFMNLFALPLFLGVSDILPVMQFCVNAIVSNKNMWEAKIKREIERQEVLKNGHLPASSTADDMLSPRSRSLSNVSLSPEQHPPALVATSAETSTPASQAQSSRDPREMSPRSSLATSGLLDGGIPEPAPSDVGQDIIGSRRSSGAYPTNAASSPPQLRPRPSSNTIPTSTQLPLGISTSSREARRSSADHSLVAVLVTSPGKSSKTTSSAAAVAAAKRHSSEKGSLPSSNDWHSQTTSPTTNITYSPTTEATSFLSETSSERGEMTMMVNGGGGGGGGGAGGGGMMGPVAAETSLAPPLVTMGSHEGTENSWTGNSSTTSTTNNDPNGMGGGKVIRQRPSRWKLGNFWRNRKKTPSSGSGAPSASGSSP
ncbi:MAG: 3',5'-cyclic-nucleotide phosphodiesterase [Peltula sp. TS41687]|nr:MAG: 3',5'-cyclic-nucleotide phosphodiesterase [Peltula sp. TS41687]